MSKKKKKKKGKLENVAKFFQFFGDERKYNLGIFVDPLGLGLGRGFIEKCQFKFKFKFKFSEMKKNK